MGLFRRSKSANNVDVEGGKIYKLLNNISITAIFVAAGILVLALTGMIKLTSVIFGLICTILIICVALFAALYWVRKIEKNEFKKTAIVFLSLLALTALLWIICLWLGVGLYRKAKVSDNDIKNFVGTLNFIKITFILSMQFMVASFVGVTVTRYRKTMIPFQVVSYISYLFLDFYFTCFFLGIKLSASKGLEIKLMDFLGTKWMISLVTLAAVYVAIASGIAKRMKDVKVKNLVDDGLANSQNATKADVKESASDKLKKLQELLDNNLITKEEYDKKREEILKDL